MGGNHLSLRPSVSEATFRIKQCSTYSGPVLEPCGLGLGMPPPLLPPLSHLMRVWCSLVWGNKHRPGRSEGVETTERMVLVCPGVYHFPQRRPFFGDPNRHGKKERVLEAFAHTWAPSVTSIECGATNCLHLAFFNPKIGRQGFMNPPPGHMTPKPSRPVCYFPVKKDAIFMHSIITTEPWSLLQIASKDENIELDVCSRSFYGPSGLQWHDIQTK